MNAAWMASSLPVARSRIFDIPMCAQHPPQMDWTSFADSTGTHRDHDVRCCDEVVPRLAVQTLGRDTFARQKCQDTRVNLTNWPTSGTRGLPFRRGEMIEDGFTEDRVARVPGTEKKGVHGLRVLRVFGVAGCNGLMGLWLGEDGEVGCVSTYGLGRLKLHSPIQAIEFSAKGMPSWHTCSYWVWLSSPSVCIPPA